MTKEDYMRLPKERLAELLVEADQKLKLFIVEPKLQCYEPGGTCTNPFHDCINCPKTFNDPPGVFTVSTSHLEVLQPDGTYKSEEWNNIVRDAIFDDDKKLEKQQ